MQDGALLRIAPTPGRPAATLVEAGQAEWADYLAMTVLRVTAQGTVGLDVRRGAGGFYRFTVNTNNQLRFARVGGGGVETLLWLGTGNVVTNCDQALTVDCVGARLTLHLNGGRLATVLDLGGPTTGGIGLYGGNTQGVRFI